MVSLFLYGTPLPSWHVPVFMACPCLYDMSLSMVCSCLYSIPLSLCHVPVRGMFLSLWHSPVFMVADEDNENAENDPELEQFPNSDLSSSFLSLPSSPTPRMRWVQECLVPWQCNMQIIVTWVGRGVELAWKYLYISAISQEIMLFAAV